MKNMARVVLVALAVFAVWFTGCGNGGDDNNDNAMAVTTPTVTIGQEKDGFVDVVFVSPLLFNQPATEPEKVAGLMDEAVQISDIQMVCWFGDWGNSWFTTDYCTTNVRNGGYFSGMLTIPAHDTGNFFVQLKPSSKGSETWFNITKWKWPEGTDMDENRGTVTLP